MFCPFIRVFAGINLVKRLIVVSLAVVLVSTSATKAFTITFSDQSGISGPMNPSVYGAEQGMPPGIVATFIGFNQYGKGEGFNPVSSDHTGDTNWKAIYGNSDPVDIGTPAFIDLSAPAQMNSLWFNNYAGNYPPDSSGDPGYGIEIVGSLAGNTVWTYSYPWSSNEISNGAAPDIFQQVTSGSNLAVDQVEFINVQDVAIDDVSIVTVPEPSAFAFLIGACAVSMRRRWA